METNQIRVLDRAVDILDVLRRNGGKARISQIRKETGLAKTTIFRILNALAARNYVQKLPDQETYALGFKLIEISFSAASDWDVINLAIPFLEQIKNEFNETGALAIKSGIRYTFVAQISCQQEYRVNPVLGERYYLHWAGTGKAILAFSSKADVRQITELLNDTAVTGKTIKDPEVLYRQLDDINKNGFAYSYSERVEGGASISAPIMGRDGLAQAAISLIGPEVRLKKMDTPVVGKRIKDIALQLEHLYKAAGVIIEYSP